MKNYRTMKNILSAGVLAVAMLTAAGVKAQSSDKPELVIPLTEPGKPYKLNVGLVSGSITCTSYEGKTINVEVQTQSGEKKASTNGPDGMRRISGANNADVNATVKNNEVTIGSSGGRRNNLIIKIPQGDVTLKLSTVNDGDITVTNVDGAIEINNVNGAIKMSGISGSVVATTVNGGVKVGFKTIDPKAPMAFSSLNGSVDVTFPASLKANVKMRSDRGDLFTDFDVTTEQRKPAVITDGKASSGMYSLKIDDWVYGKIGGGGPEVMMKTMNGNIYVRKIK
jgi:hypothetical protein